eukprot:267460-Pyramimonas_sp.AAC.1
MPPCCGPVGSGPVGSSTVGPSGIVRFSEKLPRSLSFPWRAAYDERAASDRSPPPAFHLPC